jgi:ribose transport system ATP-binding protein
MSTTSEILLDASGVAKTFGAVVALRNASLSVAAGEVHALLGANGAGKSTLVKILTGALRPDAGTIVVRGQPLTIRHPRDARRAGIASVYQETAFLPDLEVVGNLLLTDTPVEAFRHWLHLLGIPHLDLHELVRDLPLPIVRVLDLARALAVEPALLLLDEITAALPADLTERALEAIAAQRTDGRAVLFISHRLTEIMSLCDRATILRDGETVGVVEVRPGAEDRMMELMLGPVAVEGGPAPVLMGSGVEAAGTPRIAPTSAAPARSATPPGEAGAARPTPRAATSTAPSGPPAGPPRLEVRHLRAGTKLRDVSFQLHAGEVLGVVALEGQGQDELFAVLAGSMVPAGGEVWVDSQRVRFRHPADAIRRGLVSIPANRADALLLQRPVQENIALPFVATPARWGPIDLRREREVVTAAIDRLRIDTRAADEVRRLSGGTQQKVAVARWLAWGIRTLLCFDPTRGIDVRTKAEIYALLRELAAAGAAVLLYTSELKEVQLACDRAMVIFGGTVVETLPAAAADEATLLRAAHGLSPNGSRPAASAPAAPPTAATPTPRNPAEPGEAPR